MEKSTTKTTVIKLSQEEIETAILEYLDRNKCDTSNISRSKIKIDIDMEISDPDTFGYISGIIKFDETL
tara:strand:- start:1035 stop:1241 length:207 start_codon:yes stop_codon:yes gene_type:complete